MKQFLQNTLLVVVVISFNQKVSFSQSSPFANFDATANSYIDFGLGNNLNGYTYTNKFSIALWARWNDKANLNAGEWANIFTLTDSTAGDDGIFWIQHNQANTAFEFAIQTGSRSFIQSTTNPQNNTWYHLAAVYNGTTMKLYINGTEEASMAKTGNVRPIFNASKMFMGMWASPANNYRKFYGSIDEVMVFSKALSVGEITSAMANPESVTGNNYDTTSLIAYYNFDNFSATDLTPNANNGVIGQGVVLPVELKEFYLEKTDENYVNIFWVTLSELNNNYFTLEKSRDFENFDFLDEIQGAGNSNIPQYYQATDRNPYNGFSFYRLSQTDFDGKSEILGLEKFINEYSEEFDFIIYPNPVEPNSKIMIKTPMKYHDQLNVLIHDFNGRDLYTDITQIDYNDATLIILEPKTALTKGVYVVTFEINNQLISKKVMVK